jgi:H+/Cl- antiporter ClcA
MWRSFFCAIIAAMTLQVRCAYLPLTSQRFNPLPSGKLVMFEVTYHHQWKWFEMLPFMVLGALGGLLHFAACSRRRACGHVLPQDESQTHPLSKSVPLV